MTKDAWKAALQRPLPGKKAQLEMAPPFRPDLAMYEIETLNPHMGGVLVLLVEKEGRQHIVFTKRREYPGIHSGQMSFPGGRRDAADENIVATALRETEEEIGVSRDAIELLGQLTELYIPPSNFLIFPTVGFAKQPLTYKPQEREVHSIIEIPLSFFLQPESRTSTIIQFGNGNQAAMPSFVYEGHVIWGATAIVISELVAVVRSAI